MRVMTARESAFAFTPPKPKLAVLPIGATEQHSRHLPLLTDTLIAEALTPRILDKVDRPGAAYLLPTLPMSSSEENSGFGGTVSFTPMTIRGIVRDASASLYRAGIRRLVVMPWHGGNFILKPVVRELNYETGETRLLYLDPFEHVPEKACAGFANGFEIHAGEIETSMMLALEPDCVGEQRRDNPVPFNPAWQDMHSMKTLSGGEGHAGHPSLATAEKGKAFIEALVNGAAAALSELLELADRHQGY
ncbi:MAG: creatininase family protein [Kiritimatiellae bacterium]|nr:creatininase family protein [Kiritimatiellia bacterium]